MTDRLLAAVDMMLCYSYLEEAFAGADLDGDRGCEADHGRAA